MTPKNKYNIAPGPMTRMDQSKYRVAPGPMTAINQKSQFYSAGPTGMQNSAKQQFVQNLVTPRSEYVNPNASFNNIGANAPQGTPVQTPQAPAVNPRQQYIDQQRAIFQPYIDALRPPEELSAARKRVSDFDIQMLRDEDRALSMGETLGFARGEAERTNRANAIERMARAAELEALTDDYSARASAAKARLDFEKSMLPEDEAFTLSPGQIRYDSQGNILAQGAEEPQSMSELYGAGAIGEYNFARSQGYQGSFADYQNEDANRKARVQDPLLNAIREQTLVNLQNKPPTERQAKAVNFANRMQEAERILAGNSNFDPTSLGYAVQRNLPEFTRSSGAKTQLNAERLFLQGVLRLDTGATITPAEVEEYAPTYFPRENDSPALVEQKARNRQVALQGTIAEAGNHYQNATLPPAQSGASNDPLGIRK